MAVVKVVELVGISSKSWEDAANEAVKEASKTIHGVTGVDVKSQTAVVKNGTISEYHAAVKIAFLVDR